MKFAIGAAAFCAIISLSAPSSAANLVEIVLTDRLDEPRGYCLDIVGNKESATPGRGLQAHSCYSYQGQLGVDQAFDAERLKAGEYYLPWFKVCLSSGSPQEGAPLNLSACDGQPAQRFDLTAAGQIVPRSAPGLCVTVADGRGAPGGGGRPVHLLRRLTLEPCSETHAARQKWRLRAQAD